MKIDIELQTCAFLFLVLSQLAQIIDDAARLWSG